MMSRTPKAAHRSLTEHILNWRTLRVSLFVCSLSITTQALAQISFEEVTQAAGIAHAGPTFGASWGDFNEDGWPDLWVGNHNSKPTLYLNERDGTFVDIIDKVWSGDPRSDTHGAAWADFDNDGDEDLVELVGALENPDGTFCIGCGRNHLFVNENGKLVDNAKELGLDSPGLARSPLWFDADRDGRLDLLVVNTRAPGHPASTIFHQGPDGHFTKANADFGFRDAPWSRRDRLLGLLYNILHFNFKHTRLIDNHANLESAQLADLAGSEYPELILLSSPARVYSIGSKPFSDITAEVGLPGIKQVSDAAIADFDGDGKLDIYLTSGTWLTSDVIQTSANEIKGTLMYYGGGDPRTVLFRTDGKIDVQIYPTWLRLKDVFIGSTGHHPAARSFSLSPDDPEVRGPPSAEAEKGVSITYDPRSRTWTLGNIAKDSFADFIVRSTKPIDHVQRLGFNVFHEEGVDALLLRRGDKFVHKKLTGPAGADTACQSVAAGDFDNDMDVDLYLVCAGPVKNLPNRLLENDGKGNFHLVPDAGGASGSPLGRGDVVAVADYDRDGFLDLFVTNGSDPASPFVKDGPHQLFHNRGNGNHWLEIDLRGVKSNRDGIGASVILEAGGVKQIRVQGGGMHRTAQNFQRIHFGLGKNTKVDQLTIYWPSGIVQKLNNLPADHIMTINEQTGLMQ